MASPAPTLAMRLCCSAPRAEWSAHADGGPSTASERPADAAFTAAGPRHRFRILLHCSAVGKTRQSVCVGFNTLTCAAGLWLSIGGFHEQGPDEAHVCNAHVILDETGDMRSGVQEDPPLLVPAEGPSRECPDREQLHCARHRGGIGNLGRDLSVFLRTRCNA